jgi:DNA-binding MarR family transcriptional regulator
MGEPDRVDPSTMVDELRGLLGAASPGRDPDVALLTLWLTRLARLHEAVLSRLGAQHDLMPSETAVLFMLWSAGPSQSMRPSTLAQLLLQSSGGMTATLRRLEQVGLVERTPDPTDGRVSLAVLTDRGRDVGLSSFDHIIGWYEVAFEQVGPQRRLELLAATEELLEVLGDGADDLGVG